MKKLITLVAASLLLVSSIYAEGYLSANDLNPGEIKATQKEEDGFVINATTDKFIKVEDKSNDPLKLENDEKITNRISMKGSGSLTERSISFPAKAGETILIYALSSNKQNPKTLKVVNSTGAEVAELAAPKYDLSSPLKALKLKAPSTDTFTVFFSGGGSYIYKIEVTK